MKMDLPSRPIAPKGRSGASSRTTVSSKMGELALEDRPSQATSSVETEDGCYTNGEPEHGNFDGNNVVPVQSLHSLTPPSQSANTLDRTFKATTNRLPKTPNLRPVQSPATGPVMSPLGGPVTTPRQLGSLDTSPVQEASTDLDAIQRTSPMTAASIAPTALPRGRGTSPSGHVVKSRRRNSPPPPLDSEISDLVWSDAEITGHDPDDPDDDLYGINGVGFRPTAAMAEQRRAQRRKQIADWRKREDNEKRAWRRQTRNFNESLAEPTKADEEGKRVRFLDQAET